MISPFGGELKRVIFPWETSMPLTRQQHWATRGFHNFLLDRATTPFQWGENDCCMFAADAVKAITGQDIAGDFRGKYTDQASAFHAISTITGGRTVADATAYCAAKAGLTELLQPLMAQRGDLVLMQNGQELIAGIVHLNGRHVVSVGESGLIRQPITSVKRAWRV